MTNLPDFSAFTEAPSTDSLTRLSQLATELQTAELDRIDIDAQLKAKDRYIRHLRESMIPDLMEEVGLSEIKLKDGSKLTVGKKVRASIPVSRKQEALAWLAEHGYADMIKHNVVIDGGREDTAELLALVEELGFMARDDQAVHPMTLKKFVSTCLEDGEAIPLDLFGACVVSEAKLTKPTK